MCSACFVVKLSYKCETFDKLDKMGIAALLQNSCTTVFYVFVCLT